MNTLTVGALALVAGLGLGVSVTATVKMQNIEAEVVSALRTFDEEKRQRDAEELAVLQQRQVEQSQQLWDQAMKGWGDGGRGAK